MAPAASKTPVPMIAPKRQRAEPDMTIPSVMPFSCSEFSVRLVGKYSAGILHMRRKISRGSRLPEAAVGSHKRGHRGLQKRPPHILESRPTWHPAKPRTGTFWRTIGNQLSYETRLDLSNFDTSKFDDPGPLVRFVGDQLFEVC